MSRHSVLEINLAHLKFNLDLIQSFLHPHQKIIAVVKANAYGLGALKIAQELEKLGVGFFAVACINEAIQLRQGGIQGSILVLSPFFESEANQFIDYNIIPTLTDLNRAFFLNQKAQEMGETIKVHIKVDTGMGRLGVKLNQAKDTILKIATLSNLKVQGVFSHFPSADLLDDFSLVQIKKFKELVFVLEQEGLKIPLKHIANSSGIIAYNDPFFTAVRPGIILYGLAPSQKINSLVLPKPLALWKSALIEIKTLPQGHGVSYGQTHVLPQKALLGVVPVGYADGFSTLNSNKGKVLIQNQLCPILGRVCMDYFMVDLTKINAKIGDEVIIYGNYKGVKIEEVAQRTGLISYEVQLSLSLSIDRKYVFNP